jgi:hypothetical protein
MGLAIRHVRTFSTYKVYDGHLLSQPTSRHASIAYLGSQIAFVSHQYPIQLSEYNLISNVKIARMTITKHQDCKNPGT